MKYIIDGKLVEQEPTERTKTCSHQIVYQKKDEMIDGTRYRYCEKCGMVAHQDGRYNYVCWSDWCCCMQ